MDTLIEILKIVGVSVLIIFFILLMIVIIAFVRSFVKSMVVLNEIENIVLDFINQNDNQSYIWFEYLGDTGIGKVYNKGTNEEPVLYVTCIFSRTNAIQHVELSKITKYIPLRVTTLNDQEEIVLKYKQIKDKKND